MTVFDRLLALLRSGSAAEPDASPTLAQAQREALVDLLVWTMYVDRHLALAERDTIEGHTRDLPWDAVTPLPTFLEAAVTRARDVLEDDNLAGEYLDGISHRLGTAEARRRALVACHELIASDGRLTEGEARHVKRVERRFELAERELPKDGSEPGSI
ncbi:MAG: hypothetical protein AAGN66_05735 [Acidobacteriota bacterium]